MSNKNSDFSSCADNCWWKQAERNKIKQINFFMMFCFGFLKDVVTKGIESIRHLIFQLMWVCIHQPCFVATLIEFRPAIFLWLILLSCLVVEQLEKGRTVWKIEFNYFYSKVAGDKIRSSWKEQIKSESTIIKNLVIFKLKNPCLSTGISYSKFLAW